MLLCIDVKYVFHNTIKIVKLTPRLHYYTRYTEGLRQELNTRENASSRSCALSHKKNVKTDRAFAVNHTLWRGMQLRNPAG